MVNDQKFRQSVAYWCLADTDWEWDAEQICRTAKELGIVSVELAPPETYPILQKHGLTCALCFNGMPGAPFAKGLNNLLYHEEVIARTRESIDLAAEYGFPNVIAFTGYKWRDAGDPGSGEISRAECLDNCAKGLSGLGAYASAKGVTLCLEHLNSRDGSHPMKGHPGYQGDDVDFCAEIVRKVNLESVRLLFDVYHVQVMHGDIIRRLRAHRDVIGHIHTAGCPGRNEFGDRQEIHYPGVVAAIREIGYGGYIGHEFIPTNDPVQGLEVAVKVFGGA
jgi:hydroxypyruvate isomerase